MTTAREIIGGALTFHLNRLSPGETLDADLGQVCLDALNAIADEFNGSGALLFREIRTASAAITGPVGVIGTDWATLSPGVEILGATYAESGIDNYIGQATIAQYANVAQKTTSGEPSYFFHDGYASVYFYPAPVALVITLRTKQVFEEFADLDTDYGMPKGFMSGLQALLAEKLAPGMNKGTIPASIARAAAAARARLLAQVMSPAIINAQPARMNIITGP